MSLGGRRPSVQRRTRAAGLAAGDCYAVLTRQPDRSHSLTNTRKTGTKPITGRAPALGGEKQESGSLLIVMPRGQSLRVGGAGRRFGHGRTVGRPVSYVCGNLN